MKKILALVLTLVLVCSLSVAVFADYVPSVIPDPPIDPIHPTFVFDGMEIPESDIIIYSVDEALANLEGDALDEFVAFYEAAKAIKDRVVVDFFWYSVNEKYEISEEHPLYFTFDCEGENVGVTVNGKEVEVTFNEKISYTAPLGLQTGSVAILCDAE